MIAFLKDKEGELLSLKVIYKKDMKRRSTFMTVLSTHCVKVPNFFICGATNVVEHYHKRI